MTMCKGVFSYILLKLLLIVVRIEGSLILHPGPRVAYVPSLKRASICGKRNIIHIPPRNIPDEPMEKIIGGAPAPNGAYPWNIHLETLRPHGFGHSCGGTIVSEYYVITAAHCLIGLSHREVQIKIGDYDSEKKDPSEVTFRVKTWRTHPDFQKGGTYTNDIAVIKVKSRNGKGIQFNNFISPACLPSKKMPYPAGRWCYVSGWGIKTPDGNVASRELHSASVPLLPKKVCLKDHVLGRRNLQPGMLCAGYLQGQIDACNGDSGGPLVCNVDGSHTLIGVVSWGIKCAEKNKPGIYSDVQYYLDFIRAAMEEL